MFLGGMYFYHSMFDLCHGQCAIWLKLFTTSNCAALTAVAAYGAASRPAPGKGQAELRGGRHVFWLWVGVCVWWCLHWFALLARFASLHCLPAWFAALCWLLVVSALAGLLYLVTTGTPFWFVFVPAEGNRFALGTGGIRWSLLVGGLGPVLSIPKLCFKPFRKKEAAHSIISSFN